MNDVQHHQYSRNFEIQLGIYNLLLPLVDGWQWDECYHHLAGRDDGESTRQ